MKFKCLDGSEIALHLKHNNIPSRSRGQARVGIILCKIFGNSRVYEEFTIPKTRLSLDFFIPYYKIAVEVQGKQHYKQISFFHKFKHDFRRQQERDSEKRTWCEINGISLIEIHDTKVEEKEIKRYITSYLN